MAGSDVSFYVLNSDTTKKLDSTTGTRESIGVVFVCDQNDTIANVISDILNKNPSLGITGLTNSIGGEALNGDTALKNISFYNMAGDNCLIAIESKSYPETIAGQIERLQDAKAAIKTSIENKGVTIGSIDTLDKYSCCIDSISSGGIGGNVGFIDLLAVGGGGNGAQWGGGGAGGVLYREQFPIFGTCCRITIGGAGANTCFGSHIAYAGGNGGTPGTGGCTGGSAGGAGGNTSYGGVDGGRTVYGTDPRNVFQGNSGGDAITCNTYCCSGAGGGGAGGKGKSSRCCYPGAGGAGFTTSISGSSQTYAGGGAGASSQGYVASGGSGGGGGSCSNAIYYGGGGGGNGGSGYQGIVILRYLTNGDCGIHSATGGCKYTCGNYTIHCFTSNGTFCIIC